VWKGKEEGARRGKIGDRNRREKIERKLNRQGAKDARRLRRRRAVEREDGLGRWGEGIGAGGVGVHSTEQ
jgi:hypothetical protein